MSRQPTSLAGMEPICSHEQIGLQLGVTRERARQIEASALRKARLILAKRGISAEMFLDQWHRSAHPER